MERYREFGKLMSQRLKQSARPFGLTSTEEEARRIANALERRNLLRRLVAWLEKRLIGDVYETKHSS